MIQQPEIVISNLPERRLSPTAQKSGHIAAMVLEQMKAEVSSYWRVPEFLVGTVIIPVLLFLMFGASVGGVLPQGTSVKALMMASFAAYGVVNLAIFTFGGDIAAERGQGWLRLMRATPIPPWVYLIGKFALVTLFGTAILLVVFVAGLLSGVRLGLEVWAKAFFTLLLGSLSFSTLGFALGFLARPRAASTIANLVFLPLSFVSGFFFPLNQLPQFVQHLAPYLPTYHFGQLVWSSIGTASDVARFTAQPTGDALGHVLWLLGGFMLFGVLAVYGYQRDRGQEMR
ncbi:MAG: ABC transporter permease [Thermaceae bacterium]|nr:ABC transporter permease [Thermaceae bacterium]